MQLSESQQEIVKRLKRRGPATVEELAQAIGISTVAVRQHLEVLLAEGLLDVQTERRPVGRPRRRYQLSAAADDLFPKSYDVLAQTILEHLEACGTERVDEVFEARRNRMESELRPQLQGKDLAGRVAALAQAQDDAGYMAEWRQDEDGSFLFREHNCAICKVARRFPQACANELELVRSVTGAEVSREQHMAAGDPTCSYRIRPQTP